MNQRLQQKTAPVPSFASARGGILQRKSINAGVETQDDFAVPPIVHEVVRSTGRPLDPATRSFMEPRFGHDFSRISIHSDKRAAESAQTVNALAYTVGRHVVFGEGQYQLASAEGRHLLAHELAHTIQQENQRSSIPQLLAIGTVNDPSEAQADALADQVVSSSPIMATASTLTRNQSSAPILQRQPCKKSDDKIVTSALIERLPDNKCEPQGDILANVRTANDPTALGVTVVKRGGLNIKYQEIKASKCKATVSSYYTMDFDQFVFTKEGTYDDGTEARPKGGCCEGRTIARKLKIVPKMAEVLKAGEIEHCEDHRLAFAMSEGKFNQAIKDLEGDYCPDTKPGDAPECKKEFALRFKNRTGYDFPEAANQFSDCLHQKSKLRDDPPNRWHSPTTPSNSFCAKDCSSITYILDPASMPNIGKHASATIIKGCLGNVGETDRKEDAKPP